MGLLISLRNSPINRGGGLSFGLILTGLILSFAAVAAFAQLSYQWNKNDKKSSGNLYALCVGVSTFRNAAIPSLKMAAKDARDVAAFLRSQGQLFRKIDVSLLCNEQATRTEIEKHLFYKLRRAGKEDTVVLFFSGHGADDPNLPGEFFFVTYDTDPDFLQASAVNLSRGQFLDRLDSRRILLIADACYAGGYGRLRTKTVTPALKRFMQRFRESEGKVIITSSRPDEVSIEQPGLKNGVFTHFLLQGLRGRGDSNKDGMVTVQELYDFVYEQTKDATKGIQHPQLQGRLEGQFPLSVRINVDITVKVNKGESASGVPDKTTEYPKRSTDSHKEIKLGDYFVNGINPDGSTYHGQARLEKKGSQYEITWKIAKDTFHGRGNRSGDKLYINWGTSLENAKDLVTYSIQENSVLEGVWSGNKGKETLVPK